MIKILEETTKEPITMIGKMAGVCYGSNIEDELKNLKRGLSCLESGHMRAAEYPDVYMIIDEYSARVIRELYTHIGGAPTRLQSSTRYIEYGDFQYYTPIAIKTNGELKEKYEDIMHQIQEAYKSLEEAGATKEDLGNILPLGMMTKVVVKYNFRELMNISRQRECTRAYIEFRQLMKELKEQLANYSPEWKYLVENYMYPKCEELGYCPEKNGCGRKSKKI